MPIKKKTNYMCMYMYRYIGLFMYPKLAIWDWDECHIWKSCLFYTCHRHPYLTCEIRIGEKYIIFPKGMGKSKPIQKLREINWEGNWHKFGLNSDLQEYVFLASKLFREHRTVFSGEMNGCGTLLCTH
jgi:hypothetical protein